MAQNFQFASPSNYSDWANYAGFDRTTGEQKSYAPSEGIAPTNISEFMDQAIAPVENKMQKMSGIATNIGQGNMSGAYQAIKPNMVQKLPTLVSPINNSFGYHIDDLEK
jgi:hypothetical protein